MNNRTRKMLVILCLVLLVLLMILCVCSKSRMIYNEIYPQYSDVKITKKDTIVAISGKFGKNELLNQTMSKFKLQNGSLKKGEVFVDKNINKDDKYALVMKSVSAYFAYFKDFDLLFANNKLKISGSTYDKKASDDLVADLAKLKGAGVDVDFKDVRVLKPVFSDVKIVNDGSYVSINGTFKDQKALDSTVNELKKVNDNVRIKDVKFDKNIHSSDNFAKILPATLLGLTNFETFDLSFMDNGLNIGGSTYENGDKTALVKNLKDFSKVDLSKIEILAPKYSVLSIDKNGTIVTINGIFKDKKMLDKSVEKLKMFNDDVKIGDIKFDEKIHKTDKLSDVVDNLAYYFSNDLEDGRLDFSNNVLELSGSTISEKAKEDFLSMLKRFKGLNVDVKSSELKLLEPKTPKQIVKKDLFELMYFKNIEFETGSDVIKEQSHEILDKIVDELNQFNGVSLVIEGHTDDVGDDKFNQQLSEKRAMAIKEYLVSKSIDGARIFTIGYGEYRPALPNTSDENRQKNRRVEFKVKGE